MTLDPRAHAYAYVSTHFSCNSVANIYEIVVHGLPHIWDPAVCTNCASDTEEGKERHDFFLNTSGQIDAGTPNQLRPVCPAVRSVCDTVRLLIVQLFEGLRTRLMSPATDSIPTTDSHMMLFDTQDKQSLVQGADPHSRKTPMNKVPPHRMNFWVPLHHGGENLAKSCVSSSVTHSAPDSDPTNPLPWGHDRRLLVISPREDPGKPPLRHSSAGAQSLSQHLLLHCEFVDGTNRRPSDGEINASLRQVHHPLLAMLLESQSRPSYRPSPEVAHVLWMYLDSQGTCQ